MSRCMLLILWFVVLSVTGLLAKDKPKKNEPPIQVGVFVQAVPVSLGAVTQQGNYGQSVTTNLGHLVDIVDTPEARWTIEQPTGPSLRDFAAESQGQVVDPHHAWFVDALRPGDKLLFSASECTKMNYCWISVPNPDKPGKYIYTKGSFSSFGAQPKNNTKVLCGTGKLSAEVEAQVCK